MVSQISGHSRCATQSTMDVKVAFLGQIVGIELTLDGDRPVRVDNPQLAPVARGGCVRCYSLAPLGLSTMISVAVGRDDLLTMSVSLSGYRVENPFTKASTRARLSR